MYVQYVYYIYTYRDRYGVCFYKSYMYSTCLTNEFSTWCRSGSSKNEMSGVVFRRKFCIRQWRCTEDKVYQIWVNPGIFRDFRTRSGLGDVWRCAMFFVKLPTWTASSLVFLKHQLVTRGRVMAGHQWEQDMWHRFDLTKVSDSNGNANFGFWRWLERVPNSWKSLVDVVAPDPDPKREMMGASWQKVFAIGGLIEASSQVVVIEFLRLFNPDSDS